MIPRPQQKMWTRILLFGMVTCLVSFTFATWIDPDTPLSKHRTTSYASSKHFPYYNPRAKNDEENKGDYHLVFSDEFNVDDREFHDGFDPKWTSIHKDDYTNYALQFYNAKLVRTSNGFLNISTIHEDINYLVVDPKLSKPYSQEKNYQSGMVQGWNKFCFTGGIIEISAQLPGTWHTGGLWPAMWMMGNLARATYVGSSNNIWPWSYDVCKSSTGNYYQTQQLLSACNRIQHFGLHAHQGRGAPEIDILEAMAGNETLFHTTAHRPYFSASYQVAPGKESYRPITGWRPDLRQWYDHDVVYGNDSDLNIFFYGQYLKQQTLETSYVTDALSANRNLYATHFERQHVYRLEWQVDPEWLSAPEEAVSEGSSNEEGKKTNSAKKVKKKSKNKNSLSWYIDDELVYHITGDALNDTMAALPNEPMYLILNTALSATWGFPTPCPAEQGCGCDCYDCGKPECACALPPNMCELFPASFLIDYVRVYQNPRYELFSVLICIVNAS